MQRLAQLLLRRALHVDRLSVAARVRLHRGRCDGRARRAHRAAHVAVELREPAGPLARLAEVALAVGLDGGLGPRRRLPP